MNIAIITTMPFPSGEASVNRILSYSKGLSAMKQNINIISTSYGDNIWKQMDNFRYITIGKMFKNNIDKIYKLLLSLKRLCIILLSKKNNYQIIILVSNSLFLIYPLFIICKIKKIKYLQEKSEFPFVLNKKNLLGKIYAYYYIHTTYKLFDGLIIMTTPLMNYFKDKIKKNGKMFLMPMTVDSDRFCNIQKNDEYGNYIAYCGDIGGNKDGVENLIRSFKMIENKYDYKLIIIGGTKILKEENRIKNLVEKEDIKKIIFTGKIDREEIPKFLCNAKILALARPSSLQSTGGFPTKLGEYLATGNPVIVTKVGEIPYYLKDKETAFLVEPDNIIMFAEKLSYIIEHYNEAKLIGLNGKKLAETTFNYRFQSYRLKQFLEII